MRTSRCRGNTSFSGWVGQVTDPRQPCIHHGHPSSMPASWPSILCRRDHTTFSSSRLQTSNWAGGWDTSSIQGNPACIMSIHLYTHVSCPSILYTRETRFLPPLLTSNLPSINTSPPSQSRVRYRVTCDFGLWRGVEVEMSGAWHIYS